VLFFILHVNIEEFFTLKLNTEKVALKPQFAMVILYHKQQTFLSLRGGGGGEGGGGGGPP